jgi:hypothetical protein
VPDYRITVRRDTAAGWTILALIIIVGVVGAGFGASAQAPPGSGSTTATLKVVPTMRYVNVSPAKTTFADCMGGTAPFPSTHTALGYPNGSCSVGKPGAIWPVTIKNGPQADIYVQSSNAVPADGGTQWLLCNRREHPADACTGRRGRPGIDQFVVENFSQGRKKLTQLTNASNVCDARFNSSGGCPALTGQSQREGIVLIGPSKPDDTSTLWKIKITWIAVPP